MTTKIAYVIVDLIAIIDILVVMNAVSKVQKPYAKWYKRTLILAIPAIGANIVIAVASNALAAEIAYCFYYASVGWILYNLMAFFLVYTEHEKILNLIRIPALILILADTVSLFANPFFGHAFSVFAKAVGPNAVFYQAKLYPGFYFHLAVSYTALLIGLLFVIRGMLTSYDLYRVKYMIMLAVLLLVNGLNMAYMTFNLVLDSSVIFYAVAGTLIYFCTEIFVPGAIMNVAISRAVNAMNEGLLLFDISDHCIYANNFCKTRFDKKEASMFDFSSEPIISVLQSLADRGEQFGETGFVQERGGIKLHYKIKYDELVGRTSHVIGSCFLIQDVTEEVRYLEVIKEAQIEADHANNAKSAFLANMSHEIRTPLNSVLGMNEMILRTAMDPEIRDYAENIKTSGNTLLALINDILDFSKIEAGRMDLITMEYDPHQLLRECYEFFEQEMKAKDLSFSFDVSESLPSRLRGDLMHIKQILTNIISNSVKYTDEGSVSVRAEGKVVEEKKEYELTVTVSDTGRGISTEDMPYLFDSFKRVNEKENASIQGTGLGLAIVKQLLTMMNGDVFITSRVGEGTTFSIHIPQDIVDPTPAGPFIIKRHQRHRRYRELFHAPDAMILIVDDSPINLKVAKALLGKLETQTDTAKSGDEAVEICREKKYDLILMDHRMPNKDGIETFMEIRELEINKETPVIMLTANAYNGIEDQYRDLGFAGYLAKPIDPQLLEESLLRLLPPEKVDLVQDPEREKLKD